MSDGLPASTTPWRRDPGRVVEGLTAWARSRHGHHVDLRDLSSPDSGMANDTVLFTLDGERLVARLAPAPESPYPTFPTFDLSMQARVIDLVRRRTAVPAPEIVHLERSEQWVGVPFLVTRAIDGVVASDSPPYLLDPTGWFLQGTPDDWAHFESSTIAVLAELHTISDDEETAFLRPGTAGATALERHVAHMADYYEWAREGERIPILDRAVARLRETMPATDRSVLNWGDSRPGNIIYRDFEPVAVLDWEMAGVGPPELDVAWATFFQRFWAFMGGQYGAPGVVPMFSRDDVAATYERLSGVALDDLAWYEAVAAFRFGIILLRMSRRSMAFGVVEPPSNLDDLIMFVPLMEELLEGL